MMTIKVGDQYKVIRAGRADLGLFGYESAYPQNSIFNVTEVDNEGDGCDIKGRRLTKKDIAVGNVRKIDFYETQTTDYTTTKKRTKTTCILEMLDSFRTSVKAAGGDPDMFTGITTLEEMLDCLAQNGIRFTYDINGKVDE